MNLGNSRCPLGRGKSEAHNTDFLLTGNRSILVRSFMYHSSTWRGSNFCSLANSSKNFLQLVISSQYSLGRFCAIFLCESFATHHMGRYLLSWIWVRGKHPPMPCLCYFENTTQEEEPMYIFGWGISGKELGTSFCSCVIFTFSQLEACKGSNPCFSANSQKACRLLRLSAQYPFGFDLFLLAFLTLYSKPA